MGQVESFRDDIVQTTPRFWDTLFTPRRFAGVNKYVHLCTTGFRDMATLKETRRFFHTVYILTPPVRLNPLQFRAFVLVEATMNELPDGKYW